jgi:hypothetical protein
MQCVMQVETLLPDSVIIRRLSDPRPGNKPVDFNIDCPCGKQNTVSGGSAGATIVWACGQAITVPSLSKLREQAGLPPYDPGPLLLIQHLLATNQLPGTKLCAACGHETDHVVEVRAQCETSYRTESNDRSIGEVLFWLLVFTPGLLFKSRRRTVNEFGRDTVLSLPLPVCDGCRPSLGRRKAIKRSVQKIPLYGELLEKYPDAKLTLVAASK